jgi:hypothetical protein
MPTVSIINIKIELTPHLTHQNTKIILHMKIEVQTLLTITRIEVQIIAKTLNIGQIIAPISSQLII